MIELQLVDFCVVIQKFSVIFNRGYVVLGRGRIVTDLLKIQSLMVYPLRSSPKPP